jgi:hypothetical protein
MASLVSLLSGFNSDNVKRNEKLIIAIASANQGKQPTIDTQGRLHAPCNGYVYNDSVYAAGEYMSDEFNKAGQMATAKVKISVELIEAIKAVWSAVSFGKSWQGNDGITVCYAYFECLTSAQRDQLTSVLSGTSNTRKMMALEQAESLGLKHGTSWKFSASKYARALAYDLHACEYECQKDGIASDEWSLNEKTYKFECIFKGKEVCFVYPSNKDYFTA